MPSRPGPASPSRGEQVLASWAAARRLRPTTCYQAFPPGGGPWPGVVLHEAFGLNDDTRQQTDRLAAAGYLAPDLFTDGGALRWLRATFAAPNYGVLPKDLPAALQGACRVVVSYGGRDLGLRGAAAL